MMNNEDISACKGIHVLHGAIKTRVDEFTLTRGSLAVKNPNPVTLEGLELGYVPTMF
jgi:hypothetical protein